VYSTYLGGNLVEVGNAIAVDPLGNVYVTGVTNSPNFPLQNPIQADNRGGNDAFITKLNPAGSALLYSTYLGGGNDDRGSGLAVDNVGTAYVTGATSSPNFNIQFPLVAYGGGSDVFVAKLISEASISFSPTTLELQPQTASNLTLNLSAPQSTPLNVSLTSSNTNIATVPASVTIPSGATSVPVTVSAIAAGGPVTITASLPQSQGGSTATASVNVALSNRNVQATSLSVASGNQLLMPIVLASQGNENRLSFSLSLNTQLLLTPDFTLGADATNATLTVNQSQAGQGRYGIIINLPAGQKFAAGARQILVLRAVVISGISPTTTMVNFVDQPTVQRVADVNGVTLNANYIPATVTIAQGFEGDVSPRPNGSSGTVTIADWVQTGRFAAGFDTAAPGSEFQRADTAPRATLGNGAITISDWVQTGRYSAGLDPITPAGGPSSPTASASAVLGNLSGFGFAGVGPFAFNDQPIALISQQARTVRVANTSGQRGQQVVVGVEMDSLGNENALGFSLTFNPSDLTLVTAVGGPDTTGATVNVNTSQAASGRVGVAMALGAGMTFSAGTKKVITLTFTLPANGTATTIPIAFGDAPIGREVVNANADTLQVNYASGNVLIGKAVVSVSAATFAVGDLAAEQIAAAFGSDLATATQSATSIPLPTNIAGTTVNVRDSLGVDRPAPLFFVSAAQVNYQVPPGTATGPATVTVKSGSGSVSVGNMTIATVAPGLFSANSNGLGVAAAVALRVKVGGSQAFEPITQFDAGSNSFVSIPIDLGPDAGNNSDQVFLAVYGVGFRNAPNTDGNPTNGSAENVTVKVGGVNVPVLYSGLAPGFVGLDQCTLGPIPRSLAGRGEVDLIMTVSGKATNTVKVNIR
jgi:uncharacterized protein (TIGR03437 family)